MTSGSWWSNCRLAFGLELPTGDLAFVLGQYLIDRAQEIAGQDGLVSHDGQHRGRHFWRTWGGIVRFFRVDFQGDHGFRGDTWLSFDGRCLVDRCWVGGSCRGG